MSQVNSRLPVCLEFVCRSPSITGCKEISYEPLKAPHRVLFVHCPFTFARNRQFWYELARFAANIARQPARLCPGGQSRKRPRTVKPIGIHGSDLANRRRRI